MRCVNLCRRMGYRQGVYPSPSMGKSPDLMSEIFSSGTLNKRQTNVNLNKIIYIKPWQNITMIDQKNHTVSSCGDVFGIGIFSVTPRCKIAWTMEIYKKKNSLSAGFEPARGNPNGFLAHRLNHSATTTAMAFWLSLSKKWYSPEPRVTKIRPLSVVIGVVVGVVVVVVVNFLNISPSSESAEQFQSMWHKVLCME